MNFKWAIISLFLMILTACGADPGSQSTVNLAETASRNTRETYTLTKNPSSGPVSEGQTVIFSLTTTNVNPNTAVPFTISGTGITRDDIESMKLNGIIVPVSLSGDFIVGKEGTANYASLSLVLRADFTTEGTEILTVSSGNRLRSAVSVSINDTSPADTSPPQIVITGQSAISSTGLITFSGTVSDDLSVSSVTWINSLGGAGSAIISGTTWTANVPILVGSNVITFTAEDAASNRSTVSTTVTRNPPPDTTVPSISITNRTQPDTKGMIAVSGSASDNVSVVTVLWTNSTGGTGSANLSSPNGGSSITWNVSNIQLTVGDNQLTFTAVDAAGLRSSQQILVNRPAPPDITVPTIGVLNQGALDANGAVAITGTASDNVAVASVTWTNSLGGSGTAVISGSSIVTWSATVPVVVGTNLITFTATDLAGNKSTTTTSVVRLTPPDTTVPTISITEQGTVDSAGRVSIGGTATDNVAVKSVTWVNNQGGSGTATLSNSSGGASITWVASNIQLQTGDNTITVEARDAAGNKTTAAVTISRPDVQAPNINVTKQGTPDGNFVTRIEGTASDNIGVTNISWTNNLGGSGYATLTGKTTVAWFADIPLLVGTNNINFIVSDAAGNGNLSQVSVNRAPPADTTAPAIAVTNQGTMDANGIITVEGTATDDRGVMSVAWSNSLGGTGAATVSGTSSVTWYASNIQLKTGVNTITFTVSDTSGNQSSTQITVTGPASSGSTSFARARRSPKPVTKIDLVKTVPEPANPSTTPAQATVVNCELEFQKLMGQCRPPGMNSAPYQIQPHETLPVLRGVYSEQVVQVDIPDPPSELNHCNLGMRIQAAHMRVPDKEYTTDGWWLVASFIGYGIHPNLPPGYTEVTHVNRPQNTEEAYFYWARRLSEEEIGVMPTGVSTKEIIKNRTSIDVRIDAGSVILPYYWVAQFWGEQLPKSEEEPCGPRK